MAVKSKASVSLVEFRAGIIRLRAAVSTEALMADAGTVVDMILGDARNSPVPTRTGMLRESSNRDRVDERTWRFGFNKIYATFQDQPVQKDGVVVVKPVRKKWLYIPLTAAARKHIPGANPLKEGLTFGGFVHRVGPGPSSGTPDHDYVLAKESHIRIKKYGSDRGPNHYFSETFRKWAAKDRAVKALAKLVSLRLKGGGGKGRKSKL